MMTNYKAKGICLGKYWGGGSGSYGTITFHSDRRDKLYEIIAEAIKDGSIDAGMGFEKMKGALMEITEINIAEINGKDFVNEETDLEFFGDLNEEEQDFMKDIFNY